MCATWGGASKFTYAELAELHLTYGELREISDEDLLKLAQLKLERFAPKTEEQKKLKEAFQAISLNIASCLVYDAAKSVDWRSLVLGIIDFVAKNS